MKEVEKAVIYYKDGTKKEVTTGIHFDTVETDNKDDVEIQMIALTRDKDEFYKVMEGVNQLMVTLRSGKMPEVL